jgi:dihydrofolate reductase
MRPLRYSINVTLDGCCDHRVGIVDQELHENAAAAIRRADALILGRVTYQMMEDGWRTPDPSLPPWMLPFADTMNAAKKYLVSSTLRPDGWNAESLDGDPVEAVRALKQQPGEGLFVGGVTLPTALAEAGLIDEFEFVVHPIVAGHGPTLLSGLTHALRLELVDVVEFSSGVRAERYVRS